MAWVDPYESKTTDELFELLFAGEYEDSQDDWREEGASAALRVLRCRPTQKVFDQAASYLHSDVALQRARAMDILAQLGQGGTRPFDARTTELAVACLQDPDLSVVESAAYALGVFSKLGAHPALLSLSDHPSASIRLAVARGIGDLPESTPILLQLMEDPSDEVRNWATFTLGSRPEVDSLEIREALRRRLHDSFKDVHDEALWGLALRRDAQGLGLLLTRLEADHHLAGDEMTACEILDLRSVEPELGQLCHGLRALLQFNRRGL